VDKGTVLEDVQENYDVLIEDFEAKGFNPGTYDSSSAIPSAVHAVQGQRLRMHKWRNSLTVGKPLHHHDEGNGTSVNLILEMLA
jgi:hypothetical protein